LKDMCRCMRKIVFFVHFCSLEDIYPPPLRDYHHRTCGVAGSLVVSVGLVTGRLQDRIPRADKIKICRSAPE
jgi:hypothetical protein